VGNIDMSWIRRDDIILIVGVEDSGFTQVVNFIINGRLARDTSLYIIAHTKSLEAG
jgi:ABC-type uncharacterized transport system ATPase subunit